MVVVRRIFLLLFYDYLEYIALNGRMIDKLESKEAVLARSWWYSGIHLEGLRKFIECPYICHSLFYY
jgi:hypothetical protein